MVTSDFKVVITDYNIAKKKETKSIDKFDNKDDPSFEKQDIKHVMHT